MPSILRGQPPLRLVLKSDMTEHPQPAFLAKRLTFGEMKLFMILMERLSDVESLSESFETLEATLNEIVVGWENMGPYVYGEDTVAAFLDPREIMELTHMILNACQLSGSEGN